MHYFKVFILTVVISSISLNLHAQHHSKIHGAEGEEELKHVRVGVVMYHTYIGTETSEDKDMFIVPSLGLDVEYWFNEKWGVGLHNDLELVNFEVEKEESSFIERETPLLFTLDALWKSYKGLVLLLGPGIEFEKEENLFIVRAGIEYEFELKSDWDISPTIFYDTRTDAYDSFSVGIGIGKRL